mgnify:CR=1 FL=1
MRNNVVTIVTTATLIASQLAVPPMPQATTLPYPPPGGPQIQPPRPGYGDGYAGTIRCESRNNQMQRCNVRTGNRVDLQRTLDRDQYYIAINWGGRESAFHREKAHTFLLHLSPQNARAEFVTAFAPRAITERLPNAAETVAASARHWQRFWTAGGAIELSKSRDRRAHELERRIVLSQYLTAIQCAGSQPPQENGLTVNSWYGKFHLEMH